MNEIIYRPDKRVCSRQISISIGNDGLIAKVVFSGGCDGNAQGIARLVVGMNPKDVSAKLEGVNCGGRGTSCPDQLAKALKEL